MEVSSATPFAPRCVAPKLLSRRYSECQCVLCCPQNFCREGTVSISVCCAAPKNFCREGTVSVFAVLPKKTSVEKVQWVCLLCCPKKLLSRRYSECVCCAAPKKLLSRRYSECVCCAAPENFCREGTVSVFAVLPPPPPPKKKKKPVEKVQFSAQVGVVTCSQAAAHPLGPPGSELERSQDCSRLKAAL